MINLPFYISQAENAGRIFSMLPRFKQYFTANFSQFSLTVVDISSTIVSASVSVMP